MSMPPAGSFRSPVWFDRQSKRLEFVPRLPASCMVEHGAGTGDGYLSINTTSIFLRGSALGLGFSLNHQKGMNPDGNRQEAN